MVEICGGSTGLEGGLDAAKDADEDDMMEVLKVAGEIEYGKSLRMARVFESGRLIKEEGFSGTDRQGGRRNPTHAVQYLNGCSSTLSSQEWDALFSRLDAAQGEGVSQQILMPENSGKSASDDRELRNDPSLALVRKGHSRLEASVALLKSGYDVNKASDHLYWQDVNLAKNQTPETVARSARPQSRLRTRKTSPLPCPSRFFDAFQPKLKVERSLGPIATLGSDSLGLVEEVRGPSPHKASFVRKRVPLHYTRRKQLLRIVKSEAKVGEDLTHAHTVHIFGTYGYQPKSGL
ncbi:hypothetical protein K469DRAFT_748703 [Zopfia rhizophila CBS 207.26]|uniref:Uncharacterized protein n=1 Tax=Zopfia rhizophila CBS 207.26 TaxID=1314779 RepID=A0A6A6EEW0_9PEZI|nr:hypothetical protein K469DRAFT_748703 [Zopfia rhizophila CBS 207.26]